MAKTMNKEKVIDYAKTTGENVVKAGRDMWLASLGVVATVEEQTRCVFDRMVTKGKKFEEGSDTTVGKVFDRTTDRVKRLGRRVEDGVQEGMTTVLHKVGVPSHKEIQTLIARVEQLSKKVEDLSAGR